MTDFIPRRDVQAISHLNVVVDDIEVATDLGGIRHVALEVPDAVAAHVFIRSQQEAYAARGLHIEILGQAHIPEELTPFPYKFFYWIDPRGVQWEMEQGRPIDRAVKGIVG